METLLAPATIDPDIRRQAIRWYVLLNSGETTEQERKGCEVWRNANPLHAIAWSRLEAVQGTLTGVPGALAIPALKSAAINRRNLVKSIAWLALGSGAGWLAWREQPWQPWFSDFHTLTGEQRQVELADGSTLILNTATSVDVRFDQQARRLHLHRGEILVQTVANSKGLPPLKVVTRHGEITALGTRFTVRDNESHTRVIVLQHAVEISPQDTVVKQRMDAGKQITFTAATMGDVAPASENADTWTQGQLVVNDRPLSEVIAELARYRRGYLRCSPDAASIRISGVLPLTNTDQALSIIASRFPVRVASLSRYWVSVEKAS